MKTTDFSKIMMTMYRAHCPTQAPHCRGSPAGQAVLGQTGPPPAPTRQDPGPKGTPLRDPKITLLLADKCSVLNNIGKFLIWRYQNGLSSERSEDRIKKH